MARRHYLRPTQFVDTPVGRDGEVARLAGGLLWFAAWEVIVADDGRRVAQRSVPVAALADQPEADVLLPVAARVTAPRAPLTLGERVLRFDQPQAMGILNVTPDSFSDGGAHAGDPEGAAAAGVDLGAAGAALIDVGGESTRPGAETVWEGEESARVVPVIERLARSGAAISIDTRKAGVMEAALAAGAHVVNDVSALLWDPRSIEVVARAGCPVVLMHAADPKRGAEGAKGAYAAGAGGDPLLDTYDWLEARIEAVVSAGVARDRIVVDPGIGFGKQLAEDLALLNGLALFHGLGCPLLLGASRKRIVGALSNEAPVAQRLGGSLALALKGAELGAQWLRVHDVFETAQALRVWRGMRDAALTARLPG
ncbi:dihydropteroate synthase [Sphingomonas canadensis]|uniref:dihydropteroate synthase n=1 Tax=Sphingomonas canadensis TaxID=1219257 RepID=A0ABW3H5L8_9SPHN|nr:dihydropteroate synthase [Sphingomonas canadensis]MCW3835159.1 dihydropteroate synthase [Sphingomonas canadensis]